MGKQKKDGVHDISTVLPCSKPFAVVFTRDRLRRWHRHRIATSRVSRQWHKVMYMLWGSIRSSNPGKDRFEEWNGWITSARVAMPRALMHGLWMSKGWLHSIVFLAVDTRRQITLLPQAPQQYLEATLRHAQKFPTWLLCESLGDLGVGGTSREHASSRILHLPPRISWLQPRDYM